MLRAGLDKVSGARFRDRDLKTLRSHGTFEAYSRYLGSLNIGALASFNTVTEEAGEGGSIVNTCTQPASYDHRTRRRRTLSLSLSAGTELLLPAMT